MIRKFLRLQNYLEIHDRGEDRKAARSGRTLYVNNGSLRTVDNNGTVHKPLEASGDGTTSSVSPGFGSWTQADADRPAWLVVDATAETDGSSRGEVVVDVDEDGGTTADYSLSVAHVDPDNASGAVDKDGREVYVPPGAQYQVRNDSDPNGNNAIDVSRQFTV